VLFALKPNAGRALLEIGAAGLQLEVAEGVGCFGFSFGFAFGFGSAAFGFGLDVGLGVGRCVSGLWLRRRRSVDRAAMLSTLRLRLRPLEPFSGRPSSRTTVTITLPLFFGMKVMEWAPIATASFAAAAMTCRLKVSSFSLRAAAVPCSTLILVFECFFIQR